MSDHPHPSAPGVATVTVLQCLSRACGKALLYTLVGDKGGTDRRGKARLLVATTWHRTTGEGLQACKGMAVTVTYEACGSEGREPGQYWQSVEIIAVDMADGSAFPPAAAPVDAVDAALADAPADTTESPF